MTCFHPLTAWQTDSGEIVFVERGKVKRELSLPCGQCVGCRLRRSRDWAIRIMHESMMHERTCFITLTYDDDHLPAHGSLVYSHFQRFMRNLRYYTPVRFYMCGEYGEQYGRPHYHACLFGVGFDDRVLYKQLDSGFPLYQSERLSALWSRGFASVAEVSLESAAYVARYCMKKVTGKDADDHYRSVDMRTGELIQLEPEFSRMSLKPAIGATFIEKYKSDVFRGDGEVPYVVSNGAKLPAPKYYLNYLKSLPTFESDEVEYSLSKLAISNADERSSERLRARETVTRARIASKVRSL